MLREVIAKPKPSVIGLPSVPRAMGVALIYPPQTVNGDDATPVSRFEQDRGGKSTYSIEAASEPAHFESGKICRNDLRTVLAAATRSAAP